MKQTVTFSTFVNAFRAAGRESQFSYGALSAIFDELESIEQECGEEWELDVIAICCDYAEGTVADIAQDYGVDLSECEDDDDREDAVREYLENEGALVGEVEGGFVYRLH